MKKIVGVWIIGSYGTEYQREDSDIDFAILFQNDLSLMEEMDVACKISDAIAYENVDIINLKKAPILLQFKTIKEGRTLYERDYIKVSDYIEYVLNRYREEKHRIEAFRKDFYDSFNT
ncbi:hypothetical protein M918_15390 [Clostridium sp. BL8]|uniref:type VII toxin-antitoxin system MntA family adenylyltransferase antitoxin n=1 Tax=Clostridium sp. BL8 TaxID=1354301 RepID=UPI00038A12A6|nr:nucleotidyltransferase domain-containing protein [Clostridium sp. BL8]EQB86320.1 hypothetical protein M918_15390 [Clostridium sp. BL8]